MGWTFYQRDKSAETNAEHFGSKFDPRYKIIAHGTVEGVFYAALRDQSTDKVTAYVAMTRWSRDPQYNFGYKDMDENCGPGDHKAPKAVLDALTPTTHESALAWRANCRRHHAQRDFLRRHLRTGTQVRLTHTQLFTDGTRTDTFTYTRRESGHGFLAIGRSRCRIPNWRDAVAALIAPDNKETLTPVGQHAEQAAAPGPQPQTPATAA
ncbi:DUF6927 domain-containing protein [Streptomyces sp. NPDC051546]|uniref:DUF6927 domain-containing protein n=1 Tax=Streptomyces sp. NPDC051546 TaxID=3365655 RepID=UPI0037BB9006